MQYGISDKEYRKMSEDDQRFIRFMFYVGQMSDQQRTALLWRMRLAVLEDRALKVITWPWRLVETILERI